jgi:large subunit ribosomal protein L29
MVKKEKKAAVHDMTPEDVERRIAEIKQEIFNLRFRNTMRQLDNPLQIRVLRREVARLSTALSEHRHGIARLAGEFAGPKKS